MAESIALCCSSLCTKVPEYHGATNSSTRAFHGSSNYGAFRSYSAFVQALVLVALLAGFLMAGRVYYNFQNPTSASWVAPQIARPTHLPAFQLIPAGARSQTLLPQRPLGVTSSWPSLQAAQGAAIPKVADGSLPSGSFYGLGLSQELLNGLASIGISKPSPIQQTIIPQLVRKSNVAFAATTGSGKTLAYLLPLIQSLKEQEVAGVLRKEKRPRAIIFVPTRELASQVLAVTKALGHHAKIASCMVVGGDEPSKQRRALEGSVDIVVATPGRLLEHWKEHHFYLSEISNIVIDEMDTMLTQGFTAEIMTLLNPVLSNQDRDVQYVMATATMTRAVKTWLDTSKFPQLQIVEASNVNRVVDSLRHEMVLTKGRDKIQVLQEIIRSNGKVPRTMIFCNTVDAVRAVTLSLNEAGINAVSYHKELPTGERTQHLDSFKDGATPFLVCTDIGQRGLDIDIQHVILFDFPLNPVDFLHRAGRTARMGKPGTVTSVVSKKEYTLARAIHNAITKGLPLEGLTGNPNDYKDGARLAAVVGRRPKSEDPRRRRSKPAATPGPIRGNTKPGASVKSSPDERKGATATQGRKVTAKAPTPSAKTGRPVSGKSGPSASTRTRQR